MTDRWQRGRVLLVALAIALGFSAVAPAALAAPPAGAEDTSRAPEREDLGPAPELQLEAVGRPETIRLSSMLEKGPVLVDFWATWCGPCRKAMPIYVRLHERFGPRGFQVLAVSEDSPRSRDKVRLFMSKQGLPYPVVLDATREAGEAYGVRVLPTAFLIGMDGRIVSREIGFDPRAETRLAALIKTLLPAQ